MGGLYGVAIGGLFAGESMFHRVPDASKVALVALVGLLGRDRDASGRRFIDVQMSSPHFTSLGARTIPRPDFLARLDRALTLPQPSAFDGAPAPGAAKDRAA